MSALEKARTDVYLNYIGGEWARASTEETFETFDPGKGGAVSTCQSSSVEDVRRAIDAAQQAYGMSDWSSDVERRTSIILKLAKHLSSVDLRPAAEVLTRECGKPFRYNMDEFNAFSRLLENASYQARTLHGQSFDSGPKSIDFTVRDPVGVVAIIVPWNSPIILLARTLAPALAAGCTVVIKPASATSGATAALMKVFDDSGLLPRGVVNCVTGPGGTLGSELASNARVDMVSFTGSVETGKKIMELAASNVKRLTLELGGKSPNLVLADANLEAAVKQSVGGACLYHAGQICFASTRILVEESAHQRFVDTFRSVAGKMKVAHGLEEGAEIGPIINGGQLKKVMGYIEAGKKESDLVMGGNRLTNPPLDKGNFVEPTLFDNVPMEASIAREEIFGPVVTITPFKDMEEGIRLANQTNYGLSAMVFTNSLSNAMRAAKRVRAGMVWINSVAQGSGYFNARGLAGTPYKESGVGNMGTVEGYTMSKRVHVDFAQS